MINIDSIMHRKRALLPAGCKNHRCYVPWGHPSLQPCQVPELCRRPVADGDLGGRIEELPIGEAARDFSANAS
jgi:hypothetical protein